MYRIRGYVFVFVCESMWLRIWVSEFSCYTGVSVVPAYLGVYVCHQVVLRP